MVALGRRLLTTGGAPVKLAAMAESFEPKDVDKRTAPRYLAQGLVDEKAWERHLKSLPDVAEKATTVETVMADSDDFLDDAADEE